MGRSGRRLSNRCNRRQHGPGIMPCQGVGQCGGDGSAPPVLCHPFGLCRHGHVSHRSLQVRGRGTHQPVPVHLQHMPRHLPRCRGRRGPHSQARHRCRPGRHRPYILCYICYIYAYIYAIYIIAYIICNMQYICIYSTLYMLHVKHMREAKGFREKACNLPAHGTKLEDLGST